MTLLSIPLHTLWTQTTHVPCALTHPHIDTLHSMVAWTGGTGVPGSCALDTITFISRGTVATLGSVPAVVTCDSIKAWVMLCTVINDAADTISSHAGGAGTTGVGGGQ